MSNTLFGIGLRALQLPQRQGVPVAEQDHHLGRRLCVERHLQLYHTAARALQVKNLVEPNHSVAGTSAGRRLPGRHLVLPARVLDAGVDRLSGRSAARRHHVGGERGGRQQGAVELGRGGQSVRLQHHCRRADDVQVGVCNF